MAGKEEMEVAPSASALFCMNEMPEVHPPDALLNCVTIPMDIKYVPADEYEEGSAGCRLADDNVKLRVETHTRCSTRHSSDLL